MKAKLQAPKSKKPKESKRGITCVKVVGVGGGGGNAVTRMMSGERPRGVEFIAVNTDAQDLDYAVAHKKIYIGKALTRGLGAGMNPEIGKQAAEENRSEIGEMLDGADIVFITAGMGGGTGTSGSAVIAEIAKEKGILTVAVVTKPFAFEGAQRMNIAQEGLSRLKEKVDALVVIPNDRIFTLIDKDTPILKAFAFIDDVLKQAVQAITELINTPGIINVDFADIKTVLKDAGTTLIGIGTASGQDRGIKAVSSAINSPLLEVSLEGAKGIVFSIAGTKDMKMSEINDIAKAISANLDNNARVIFGAYHDRGLKDKALKVTVIATGFNGAFPQRSMIPTLFMTGDGVRKDTKLDLNQGKSEKEEERITDENERSPKLTSPKLEKNEPWEIPTFLRKKKK
ncbi:cell division protein FtsZ [bacterium]|nr:MAG: cell division protein FtsZ [bacterium]